MGENKNTDPHCINCDYYVEQCNDDACFGICEVDLPKDTAPWGWCENWTERKDT